MSIALFPAVCRTILDSSNSFRHTIFDVCKTGNLPSLSVAPIGSATHQCPTQQRQYATQIVAQGKRKSPAQKRRIKPGRHRPAPERDATGALIHKKQEKRLGAFMPLPPNQLTKHELLGGSSKHQLDLPVLDTTSLTPDMIGKLAAFSQLTNSSPFRIFGMPKKALVELRLLSKPCSVIRDVTLNTIKAMEDANHKSSLDTRLVLSGRPGCGKSYLLMQTVEYCMSKGWIVLYIPRAVNLVNSTTTHVYDLRTQTYLQPVYSYRILQRFLTVNSAALQGLVTTRDLLLERRKAPTGTQLAELINLGVREQALAPIILDMLMEELGSQTKFPVLLAVDDFQALYCKTTYKDPHFQAIRSFHLSIPRLIMDFACGNRSFARGAVLGAITSSDPLFTIPLELREALGLPYIHPTSPYDKRSATLNTYTKGLNALPVPDQLSVKEAASMFEVWMKDRAVHSSAWDETFLSKYSESSGNARDFVWKGLLASLET